MPLNIKNEAVERLVDELAVHMGESKTEAVRRAVEERLLRARARGMDHERLRSVMTWLQVELWAQLPAGHRGVRIASEEEDEILGYGPEGV